jgi:pyrroline-5-carboxylate reductase
MPAIFVGGGNMAEALIGGILKPCDPAASVSGASVFRHARPPK